MGSIPEPNVPSLGRILVVDDAEQMHLVLQLVLASDGWRVEHATSGEEAVARCRRERFDVVVVDHWMPGLSGVDVVRRLHAVASSAPVVVFSAFLDAKVKSEYEALGVTTVEKFDWKELVRRCRLLAGAPDSAVGF